jgi:hypothetical protein
MESHLEIERQDERGWLAAVPELQGVPVGRGTASEAWARAQALALRALAGQTGRGDAAVLDAAAQNPSPHRRRREYLGRPRPSIVVESAARRSVG